MELSEFALHQIMMRLYWEDFNANLEKRETLQEKIDYINYRIFLETSKLDQKRELYKLHPYSENAIMVKDFENLLMILDSERERILSVLRPESIEEEKPQQTKKSPLDHPIISKSAALDFEMLHLFLVAEVFKPSTSAEDIAAVFSKTPTAPTGGLNLHYSNKAFVELLDKMSSHGFFVQSRLFAIIESWECFYSAEGKLLNRADLDTAKNQLKSGLGNKDAEDSIGKLIERLSKH